MCLAMVRRGWAGVRVYSLVVAGVLAGLTRLSSVDMLRALLDEVAGTGANARIVSPWGAGMDLDVVVSSKAVLDFGGEGNFQGSVAGSPGCSDGGKLQWHPATSTLTWQDVRNRVVRYGCHRGPLETVLPRPVLTALRRYGLYARATAGGSCPAPCGGRVHHHEVWGFAVVWCGVVCCGVACGPTVVAG